MSSKSLFQGWFSILMLSAVVSTGCSSGQSLSADTLQTAQQNYDEAEKAYLAKDYATAEAKFAASTTGGLPVDLLARAYLYRGIALGYLGRKDEALAELEKASCGEVGDREVKKARNLIESAGKSDRDKSRTTASAR